MTDPIGDAQNNSAHARLVAWLDEFAIAFEEWKNVNPPAVQWDFTLASLDVLEGLLRSRYSSEQELKADRSSALVQGACWYLGETVRRLVSHVEWRYDPVVGEGAPLPERMFAPGVDNEVDTPHLVRRGNEDDYIHPMNQLEIACWPESEREQYQMGPLRDVIHEFD